MPNIGDVQGARSIGYKGTSCYIWQSCTICGKQRWVPKSKWLHGGVRHCKSCQTTLAFRRINACMDRNPHWQDGKHYRADGYIYVKLARDDFFYPMAEKSGYVLEHRLIMARHMKRCLLAWEVVHHKNGIRNDNRLENLALIGISGRHNTALNKRIKQLERIVARQDIAIKLLQFQIQESTNVLRVV